MFIKVKRFNMECLLNIHKIEAVVPMDDGKRTSIKAEGHSFDWEIPFDQAQDVLIDNAAQVTAPIASRVMALDNTLARTARSVEDLLEKLDSAMNTPIFNCDGMTPEEEARFRRTMDETRATLDSIQPRLVSQPDGTKARLMRAEALLAEVYHVWDNDAGASHVLGQCLGQNIGNFLYPGEKNACDKE